MDIIKRIKEYIAGKDRKKLIENAAIAVIIGVIVIIAGSTVFRSSKTDIPQKSQQKSSNADDASQSTLSVGDDLEMKLQSVLSQIQGVGKTDVMITYKTTRENVPAYDINKNQSSTEEKDSEGGTRSIRQEEYDSSVVFEDGSGGGKIPVILKELEPEVKGVLVVAEGAGSIEVRERILHAVTVVLDIPVHKVEIVQRKK